MSDSGGEDGYDAVRQRNIREMQAMVQKLLDATENERNELQKLATLKAEANKPPEKRKRARGRPRTPKVKVKLAFRREYETRYASKRVDYKEDDEDDDEEPKAKRKYFTRASKNPNASSDRAKKIDPFFTMDTDAEASEESDNDYGDDDDDDYDDETYAPDVEFTGKEKPKKKKKTEEEKPKKKEQTGEEKPKKKKTIQNMSRVVYDPTTVLSPDQVSQEMLDSVANRSMEKVHDPVEGTTCHQCRQKTKDFKTICRSGVCIGVRGQFCGPCLRGRYGESAVEVLKDPDWVCPVCRDICNCSICLRNTGREPTGILLPTALKEGYKSVKDYYEANGGKMEDEDYEEGDEEED